MVRRDPQLQQDAPRFYEVAVRAEAGPWHRSCGIARVPGRLRREWWLRRRRFDPTRRTARTRRRRRIGAPWPGSGDEVGEFDEGELDATHG